MDTGIQGYMDTGIQGDKDTEIHRYRDIGIQDNMVTGIQGFRDTAVMIQWILYFGTWDTVYIKTGYSINNDEY